MKRQKSNPGWRRYAGRMLRVLALFLSFALPETPAKADDVGDISADASAIYTGNTFHGYAEMRVELQNRSHGKSHIVTLIYPNKPFGGYGNHISQLSRTVTLAPESSQIVSLLQPPLPSQGDSSIRVEVDDGHEGEIRAPNANNHCNIYSRGGGGQSGTVFISRSLDDSAVEHLFHANQGSFTAAMAVGAPDATGPGAQPTSWMPDSRRYGETNWLELDYSKPQTVNKILVYQTQSQKLSCAITLISEAGTNVAVIPVASGKMTSSGTGWISEFDVAATNVPIKTVRLNFGKSPPYTIAIDAVQISGPTDTQWASDARASSDNSSMSYAYSAGPAGDTVESMRSESAISDWSTTWLAYSPFDCIVLTGTDIGSMSPAVLGAIGSYVNAGGTIVLFDAAELPAVWHPWQQNKLNDGVEYKVGFGRCYTFASENPAALDKQSIQVLRTAVRDSAAYWQSLPQDDNASDAALPIHGNMKVPVHGIVLIMLGFVILIGPINIIYLARIKRRVWMLWTIPAISFATTLLVFLYSLLSEGITPDVRISGLTVLDQVSHQASTYGGTAFYSPLTPSRGLQFEYETEATPLVAVGYNSGSSREVDWTQSQHFNRGWVSARIPAYFHLRKSETARQRIEVSNENGTLQIVNGLGAPIKSLWMADANMNLYEVNNVPAGEKTSLAVSKAMRPLDKAGPDGLRRDLGFAATSTDVLNNSAQSYLRPNTYVAVLDGNPFIENALTTSPNMKHTKISSVVFGILDSPETK